MTTQTIALENYSVEMRYTLARAQKSADEAGHAATTTTHAIVALLEAAAKTPVLSAEVAPLLANERRRLEQMKRGVEREPTLSEELLMILGAAEREATAAKSAKVEAVHFLQVLAADRTVPESLVAVFAGCDMPGAPEPDRPGQRGVALRMKELAARLRGRVTHSPAFVEQEAAKFVRSIHVGLGVGGGIPEIVIDVRDATECEISRAGRPERLLVSFDGATERLVLVGSSGQARRFAWDPRSADFVDEAGDVMTALEEALDALFPPSTTGP